MTSQRREQEEQHSKPGHREDVRDKTQKRIQVENCPEVEFFFSKNLWKNYQGFSSRKKKQILNTLLNIAYRSHF